MGVEKREKVDASPPIDLDQDEMESDGATASVDWEIPVPSLLLSTPSKKDVNVDGEKTVEDKFEITTGRAKVQRELKIAGPYDTHRQRIGKIFSTVLMILGGIFLLNAVAVSLSLWRFSRLQPEDIDIRQVELYDLDKEVAHAAIDIQLPNRWYFHLFRVTIYEPTTIHIFCPEAIHNHEQKWTPILSVRLPTVTIGRSENGLHIKIRDIPIQYGLVPLQGLLDYFLLSQKTNTAPRRVMTRVEFEVETTSYWIPIHFSHALEQEIELPPMNTTITEAPYPMPTLEGVEYVEESPAEAINRLAVRLHIEYPRRDIPPYLLVKIPEIFFDVGFFAETLPANLALSSNSVAQVKLLPHIMTGDIPTKTVATIELSTQLSRKDAFLSLLTRIREGDFSWSVMVGLSSELVASHEFASLHYLQRWLATLHYDISIREIANLAQFPLSRFEKRAPMETFRPAIKMGLVQIDTSPNTLHPRIVVSMSIEKEYLQTVLGGILPPITRPLPTITLHALIDRSGNPPTEILNMDIRHHPHPRKLKFLLYVGIVDLGTAMRAVDKAAHTKILTAASPYGPYHGEVFDYNSVYLHFGGDRLLDRLLRVFEVQLSLMPGGGFAFRHGSRRAIKFGWDDNVPLMNPEEMAKLEAEIGKMRHDLKMDVLTDTETVHIQGGLKLHSEPPLVGPFVRIFWNAIDLSLYPVVENIGHVELLHMNIKKNALCVSLAATLPLAMQRIYGGVVDFDIFIRQGTEEVIDGVPAFIKAWRHIALQFEDPEAFPQVHIVGRIGDRHIDFPGALPSRAQLLASSTDVPRMVIDVIKTRVRIAGFTEAVLHVLLELPELGDQCTATTRANYRVALGLALSLPALHANGCFYPNSKGDQLFCLATVGLHPIIVGVDLLDGQFCDIRTRLAKPGEQVYERPVVLDPYGSVLDPDGQKLEGGRKKIPLKGHYPIPPDLLNDAESMDGDTLINYLPLSVELTDLRRVFDTIDKLVDGGQLRRLKVSVGFSDRKELLVNSKKTSLLDRFLNGVGQAMPLKIPLYSKKSRPKRPPIQNFYQDKPIKLSVDVSSKNPRAIKGRIWMELPEASLPEAPKGSIQETSKLSSLMFLLVVQWGRTIVSLKHGGAWFKVRISQGQVTFRLDKDRVLLGSHHENIPFTRKISIDFALGMRDKHCSTASLRTILGHLHNYANKRTTDRTSKRLRKEMKSRLIEFRLNTLPFVGKRSDGIMPILKDDKGREKERKSHVLRQQLRISTVVEVAKRAWHHWQKRSHAMPKGPPAKIVITPSPYSSVQDYRLPCFIPGICTAEELARPPPSGKFLKADVTAFGVIQPIVRALSFSLGQVLDKLNFRAHPQYMVVRFRVSAMEMGLALNGNEVVQFSIDPITVGATTTLTYPQHLDRGYSPRIKKQKDTQVIPVHVRLAPGLSALGDLLRPLHIDAGFNINLDPAPRIKHRGRILPLHHGSLSVSLTTQGVTHNTLLSTFIAMGMPEMPAGFIPSILAKGEKPRIRIIKTSRDGMTMKISQVAIPNPLPFAAIAINHSLKCSYIYKGHEFARVHLGKLHLIPGSNPISAIVKVSRSAFGKLKNEGDFIPEFSEFLAGLAMSQELKVDAIIHFGRNFRLHSKLAFPRGKPSMGTFNEKNSYPDLRDVHEVLAIGRAVPGAAWYATKQVAGRLREDVRGAWSWTWKKLSGMYGWVRDKIWGKSATIPPERQLRDYRPKDREEFSRELGAKKFHKRSEWMSVQYRPRPSRRPNRSSQGWTNTFDGLKKTAVDGVNWAWDSVKSWWDNLGTELPSQSLSQPSSRKHQSSRRYHSPMERRRRRDYRSQNMEESFDSNQVSSEEKTIDYSSSDDSDEKGLVGLQENQPPKSNMGDYGGLYRWRGQKGDLGGEKKRPMKLIDYFDNDDGDKNPVLDMEEMTRDMLLDKKGMGKTRVSQRRQTLVNRRLAKNRNYNKCRIKKTPKPSKSSKRWEERIKNTKKAKKRFHKTQKRLGTIPSHDSIPSSEEEFDKLLGRKDYNNLYYRGMRHRPDDEMNEFFDRERAKYSSSGSSYEYVSPEYIAKAEKWGRRCEQKPKEGDEVETILPITEYNDGDDGESGGSSDSQKGRRRKRKESRKNKHKKDKKKSKKLYRRALSSSEESSDTEGIILKDRSRRGNDLIKTLPKNGSAKSWREIINELKDTGKTLYSRLLKNIQKVNYHIALNNEHEFVVMIAGMLMHMEFLDFEGQNYGLVSDGLQALLGAPKGKPIARVLLAPRKCQKDGLSNAQFLRCLRQNVRKAPVVLPPRHRMSREEAVKAVATMTNYQTGPQIMDQFLFRNGICIAVRPSLVSVALARPQAPRNEEPFQANLLITMDRMPVPNTPFSDPCHQSIQCLPMTGVTFHRERTKMQRTVRSLDSRTQKKDYNNQENFLTTRVWNRKPIHILNSIVITFKFRFSYLNRLNPSMVKPTDVPGISLIFARAGKKLPTLSHRTSYGYVGVGDETVALVIDPWNMIMAIHRDGKSTPLMVKKAAPFPPRLSHNQWYQVYVHYRPPEKKLVVSVFAENAHEHKFVSIFPLNLPRIIAPDRKRELNQGMIFGIGTAASGYAIPTIKNWRIISVLPDLKKTRIYYLDAEAPMPHERGRFVVELRDRCDRMIGLGPVPIAIQLVRLIPSSLKRHAAIRANTLSAVPDAPPQPVKIRPDKQHGLYLATYRVGTAGTYNIRVAFSRQPKHLYGAASIPMKWCTLEHQHIYVRNIW